MTLFDLKKKKPGNTKPSFPATREIFLFTREVLAAERDVSNPEMLLDIEIGSLLDYDYKYTHQWRFGKKRMVDSSELEELAEKIGVRFEILQKLAVGVWDAKQAFTVHMREQNSQFETIETDIEIGSVRLRLDIEIPENRKELFDEAIASLKEDIEKRQTDPDSLVSERQAEIRAFEQTIKDLNVPRISFYRKNK